MTYFQRHHPHLKRWDREKMKAKLLARIKEIPETGCWEWQGPSVGPGYGVMYVGDGNELTHRISYQVYSQQSVEGWLVCHHCDNPKCCNPSHLFRGTHLDNMKDCRSKDRHNRGERNGNATLDSETILQIRFLAREGSMTQRKIAAVFGIQQNTVSRIKEGKRWSHV